MTVAITDQERMDEDTWIPPHRVLGIAEDADETAIRKAYAVKLKTVRPDTDPVAFQKLVEARDVMLRWAGMPRVVVDDADEGAHAPIAPVTAEPTPPPSPGHFAATSGLAPSRDDTAARVHATVEDAGVPKPADTTAISEPHHDVDDRRPTVGSQDILDLLDNGLNVETPLDCEHVETVFAQLPAGALRWAESDIIELLAAVARRFEREPYPDAVCDAYDLAFVRLADIFDWETRDRTIHETLSSDDAHVFFVVLGRALRRHVPGYAGRYARPRPAAASAPTTPQRWFSWASAWTWGIVVMLIVQLARCAGDGRLAGPAVHAPVHAAWLLDVNGKGR